MKRFTKLIINKLQKNLIILSDLLIRNFLLVSKNSRFFNFQNSNINNMENIQI